MIIDDEDPASPSKGHQALPTTTRDNPEDVPPPAYSAPSTPFSAPVHDPSVGLHSPLLDPETQYPKGEPAGRRFLKAFAIAALIWFSTAILFGSVVRSSHPTSRDDLPPFKRWPSKLEPNDGKVLECRTGKSGRTRNNGQAYSTSFEMPIPSEAFYIFARGAYSSGNLDVVHDTDWTLRDTLKVDIQAAAPYDETLRGVSVCRMERKKGEQGIGLLAPEDIPNHHQKLGLTWVLRVQLPPSVGFSPLFFPAFETILPHFTQTFDDMHDDVVFGFLGLASTNSWIYAHSISADVAGLLNSDGGVGGDFSVGHLEVVASNQPIAANVTVIKDDENNGTVLLKSSNGAIQATVSLLNADHMPPPGTFDVVARTTNAPLELSVVDMPIGADVHIGVRTSSSAATLHLPPQFEGNFELRATNSVPDVKYDSAVRDPTGRRRPRAFSLDDDGKHRMTGAVGWVDPSVWLENHARHQREQNQRQANRRDAMRRSRERLNQYLQLVQELEEEHHSDGGVEAEPVDGGAWDDFQRGRRLNSSAIVVTSNGPAVLDLT